MLIKERKEALLEELAICYVDIFWEICSDRCVPGWTDGTGRTGSQNVNRKELKNEFCSCGPTCILFPHHSLSLSLSLSPSPSLPPSLSLYLLDFLPPLLFSTSPSDRVLANMVHNVTALTHYVRLPTLLVTDSVHFRQQVRVHTNLRAYVAVRYARTCVTLAVLMMVTQ